MRLGCFGSYARREAGVGSDLDLVAVVERSDRPFLERPRDWPTEKLPVPAEILVYTLPEWDRLQRTGGRFATTLATEMVWLVDRSTGA
ncbi:MAG TPA: nucleotidyltransferase domain-containing protein [Thermoanaerobaculia bacterium]